jgi:hypothetical protein
MNAEVLKLLGFRDDLQGLPLAAEGRILMGQGGGAGFSGRTPRVCESARLSMPEPVPSFTN